MRIISMDVHDVRFPTSKTLAGSDAMNPEPDYSAAYVVLSTDSGLRGFGLTFTNGRGTEVVAAACRALSHLVVGRTLDGITDDMGGFWRSITGDSQLRWIGPEKGAIHMATGAVVNAVWDLWARAEGLPVWRLVSELSPERIADCVDFRYLTDTLTRDDAVDLLRRVEEGRNRRIAEVEATGYPAYITSVGWLGYSDSDLRENLQQAMAAGWNAFKIKVGRDPVADRRRLEQVRDVIGEETPMMIDANQVWEVDQAIRNTQSLADLDIYWIEEPTCPDDVLGHQAIARALRPQGVRVATGEHAHSRVMFKQFLAADAIDVVQADACRVGGLNEVLAILLLAAHHDVPVCPHAGGVGLCEYVQHVSLIDYVAVSGQMDGRMTEYAGHLHEQFTDPVTMDHGRYVAPTKPGYSVELHSESLARYRFPDGGEWL